MESAAPFIDDTGRKVERGMNVVVVVHNQEGKGDTMGIDVAVFIF